MANQPISADQQAKIAELVKEHGHSLAEMIQIMVDMGLDETTAQSEILLEALRARMAAAGTEHQCGPDHRCGPEVGCRLRRAPEREREGKS
ncbi:MAG: hypothetical protein UX31_C0003G0009 [Candidatus Nomurabacteria bacterium GW2011_GWA1_46_11]|uniref:Uncharacterized protein n=1 Tax=Candidatus Nomurabacteria bacterium GW2011_GWA1_46_11 TaxID=1618732 RepID=A0A0G1QX08_9BACT|nr:MAG: hypothetical protein UW69_C0071G0002 [Microgenomates group bacterium GW2011_GWA2_44_7]KKT78285.1 MAG: hypothetical protein UW73_C0004G0009 [Microgenomates group bacterium GW2011_GWB1_44_8]KKU22343.1 MAG: hypothetical protein UX31_C0003G0009 [Candidatus Nomurabacteria bacterium GW2011_GWA1_46_11]